MNKIIIELIPVSGSFELKDDLEQIYNDSFPRDERREWQEQKRLLDHPNFNLNKISCDGKSVGLITYWNLPDLLFIEHFAIQESMRGKGIGSFILRQIINEKHSCVVLEVEEPITEFAQRRIDFYRQFGFSLCDNTYYQPPYSTD